MWNEYVWRELFLEFDLAMEGLAWAWRRRGVVRVVVCALACFLLLCLSTGLLSRVSLLESQFVADSPLSPVLFAIFSLSLSVSLVSTTVCLSLFLFVSAVTPTTAPHSLVDRYYWAKFKAPDRVLFPIFWTGVLVDICHPNWFLHSLLTLIVLKFTNYFHHSQLIKNSSLLCKQLDSRTLFAPEAETRLLFSSSRVSLACFLYFLLIRKLGSLVWAPIITHFFGIAGLFLGQLVLDKLDLVGKGVIKTELAARRRKTGNKLVHKLSSPKARGKSLCPGLNEPSGDETRESCGASDHRLVLLALRTDDDEDWAEVNNDCPLNNTRENTTIFSSENNQIELGNGYLPSAAPTTTSCTLHHLIVSCENKMRRTSLPAALPHSAHRGSIHQGSGMVDTALLYEAHGLVTEMLVDQAALPANVVAGLKALSTLLKPNNTPIHCTPRARPAPLTLSTDPDYTSDVDEIPYTGEKLSTMPKRNSGPGKKGVSGNLLRRMSTSTWTTTTSATGMPTLEPQPHSRRRRSASFRSQMEGTPGSSPTSGSGLIPIALMENKENVKVPSALSTFKLGTVTGMTTGGTSGQSTPHIPNAALQSSHKARSFSAFALNASTVKDARRRFSQQEVPHSNVGVQRKTVCSLHPLSPSDLSHLNALAASTGISSSTAKSASASVSGSNRSSPLGTPVPSPIPSPVPSRDPSPCHYSSRHSSTDTGKTAVEAVSVAGPSSECRLSRDCSPPKVIFQSEQSEGDSLGLLSGRNLSSYLDNPDEDCSNASTLGDGPGPPDSSSGNSNSVRLSPVTFTLQQPPDNDKDTPLDDFREGVITVDDVQFHLSSIASDPYLCRLSEWDYPIFDLERSSKTQILSHMCYKVFLETGLFETFKIPIKEFINYFHALELGYRDKPYHNRMHAADVLQGVFYFTTQAIPGFQMVPPDPDTPNSDWSAQRACFNVDDEGSYGIMGANFPALELMALYTAAAMHDFDHPGRTNAFLVTTNSQQAILYNDRSVLENHHAAAAWALLLNNENFNFLKYLDKAEFKRFRFLVIEAILATDLKRHFEILSEFNSKVNEDESPGIDWSSEEDRLLVMEICIKLSDINGPCKYHDIHVQWTYRIAEEFYEQGDEEVRLGLPISPFMDRFHPQLAKLQESFINHLVAPLCKACAEAGLLPGYWEDEIDEDANEGETTNDELSQMSWQETDNENDESSYSDDNKSDCKLKRKIFCLHTKHLQDNHRYWMNVIKEESKKKDEGVKTESVAISTEDTMETIEEENNTPHSLNRSFSFVSSEIK